MYFVVYHLKKTEFLIEITYNLQPTLYDTAA